MTGSFKEQLAELKRITGTQKNIDLAKAIGRSPKTISNWKQLGYIPENIFFEIRKNSKNDESITNSEFVELNFFDVSASAGFGSLIEVEVPTDISFSKSYLLDELNVRPEEVFMMRVGGDSMYPTLQDGSLIVVKNVSEFYGDGVYVFRINGQVMVKRLQFQPTKIVFKSDNIHLYEPWDVSHKELADIDFQILGRVIWSGGKI